MTAKRAAIGLAVVAVVLVGASVAVFLGNAPSGVASVSPPPGSANPSAGSSPSPSGSSEASGSPSPEVSPSPSPLPTPVLVPAPLDGLPVSPKAASRHVVAVMIDDLFRARPQSGFAAASVVWQAPAEGGIPRYMMLFQENIPADVGPVRSARYYFITWAAEWRAGYVHAGGSPQALATLRAKGSGQYVYNLDEFRWGGSFWRVGAPRFAPHNLYTDGKQLRRLLGKVKAADKPMQPAWTFGADAALEDRPTGGTIDVAYPANKIHYAYDRATNAYKRSVTGEKRQRDGTTKTFVAPKNVVVMLMHFGPLNDGSKKHRLEAQVTGSGPAWFSSNGKTIKGTWRKASITAPTLFFTKAGKPVQLTAGQTFVQVVPYGTVLKFTPGKTPTATYGQAPAQQVNGPSPRMRAA